VSATKWEKLPALPGKGNPCVCCPPIGSRLHMDSVIAVGFGDAHVSRDGEVIYREPSMMDGRQWCDACDGCGSTEGGESIPTECWKCKGEGSVADPNKPEPTYWDVAEAEKAALADPDHDWRIVLFGPLHGEVYQRHEAGAWMLVEKNEGFA
jgi:hypothetical protein